MLLKCADEVDYFGSLISVVDYKPKICRLSPHWVGVSDVQLELAFMAFMALANEVEASEIGP